MRVLLLTILCICVSVGHAMWRAPASSRRRGGSSLATSGLSRLRALLTSRRSNLFGGRIRSQGSIFSHIVSRVKQPICYFDKNNVPQFDWPTKDKLCFDYSSAYPFDRMIKAVGDDPDALEYLTLVQESYIRNLWNSADNFKTYRYRDLCQNEAILLERIWWTNTISKAREVCYVIMPEGQGIEVANCGRKNMKAGGVLQKKCVMDNTDIQNHFCVPDGFVDRDIYVFCPGEKKQCRRTRVTIPTGCSCKKYDCLKYDFLKK